MKTVTVVFTERYSGYSNRVGRSTQTYDYVVQDDVVVQADDFAVAHNGSEFAIVKVVSVSANVSQKATKTLVTILSKDIVEAYHAMNKSLREQKALLARLDVLLAQESERNKYRYLAESNEEAKNILVALGYLKAE